MQALQVTARLQERARSIVPDSGRANRLCWELDGNWQTGLGVAPGSF